MKNFQNEEALDVLADILEPVAVIFADDELKNAGETRVSKIRVAIKRHKAEILDILARLEDVPRDEFKVGFWELPLRFVEFLNMPGIQELFTSQLLKNAAGFSGAATANTEDGAE